MNTPLKITDTPAGDTEIPTKETVRRVICRMRQLKQNNNEKYHTLEPFAADLIFYADYEFMMFFEHDEPIRLQNIHSTLIDEGYLYILCKNCVLYIICISTKMYFVDIYEKRPSWWNCFIWRLERFFHPFLYRTNP